MFAPGSCPSVTIQLLSKLLSLTQQALSFYIFKIKIFIGHKNLYMQSRAGARKRNGPRNNL